MKQKELNAVRIDDLYVDGQYKQMFVLPLTAKHELWVGSWQYDGQNGVDLRRYSYNEQRLLGEGISVFQKQWEQIYTFIYELRDQKLFDKNMYIDNKAHYEKQIVVDENFSIRFSTFEGDRNNYFCLNLCNKNGKDIYKGKHARIGIMIRFDKVNDFLDRCIEKGLIRLERKSSGPSERDKKTGRKIY
jgi:hypothetical protein